MGLFGKKCVVTKIAFMTSDGINGWHRVHYADMADLIDQRQTGKAWDGAQSMGERAFPEDIAVGDVVVVGGVLGEPRRPLLGARRAAHLIPQRS